MLRGIAFEEIVISRQELSLKVDEPVVEEVAEAAEGEASEGDKEDDKEENEDEEEESGCDYDPRGAVL